MQTRRPDGAGVTPFQRKVYDAVAAIPRGRVATYKQVAAGIGCASCRAVGQALKGNPFAPAVPCHRVIASDLTLGGFRGKASGRAVAAKQDLLRREGVTFAAGRLLDERKIWQSAGK